jgi:hypothetical protein
LPSDSIIRLHHLRRHQIVLLNLALSIQPGRQAISPHQISLHQHRLNTLNPSILNATMSAAASPVTINWACINNIRSLEHDSPCTETPSSAYNRPIPTRVAPVNQDGHETDTRLLNQIVSCYASNSQHQVPRVFETCLTTIYRPAWAIPHGCWLTASTYGRYVP